MWALMAAGQKEERARVLFQSEVEETITDATQECLILAGRHLSVPNIKIQPDLSFFSFSSSSLPPLSLTFINPHADGLSGQSLSAGNDMQSTGFLN